MSEREQRELDVWIASHVMGWVKPDVGFQGVPHYTSDAAAAMQVLEKCARHLGHTPSFTLFDGTWIFTDQNGVNHKDIATLPLAICGFAKELFLK